MLRDAGILVALIVISGLLVYRISSFGELFVLWSWRSHGIPVALFAFGLRLLGFEALTAFLAICGLLALWGVLAVSTRLVWC